MSGRFESHTKQGATEVHLSRVRPPHCPLGRRSWQSYTEWVECRGHSLLCDRMLFLLRSQEQINHFHFQYYRGGVYFFFLFLYNASNALFLCFFTLHARCVCGTIPYITQALLPSRWTPAFPRWASCSSQFGTWTTLVASSSAPLKAWRAWRRAPRPRRPSTLSEHNDISITYHNLKLLCQAWWKIKAFSNISIEMFMQCMKLFFFLRAETKPEMVKTEMGPPPSPASTCSDTSSIASSASLPYSTYCCTHNVFSV